jgi:hypothetical protein
MRYLLINSKTNEKVGDFSTRQRASRKQDKLDNEYGGYIHHIKEVI